jgi:hypothetical protein
MNYPDTVPADLSAFSLWPDAVAASEEEMAMWAQAAGYAQPGFTFENVPLDDLDATLTWGQSSTTPGEIFDFQNNSVSILPSSLGRGRTYFVIEYQLDVWRDSGRGSVEPGYPPPKCHRDGCIRASHHATLLQQQHGCIHSRVLPPNRKHATTLVMLSDYLYCYAAGLFHC